MPPPELARLLPRHFKIMDLCLEGLSNRAIASELEMSPQAISLITKSPIFQSEISRRQSLREVKIDQNAISEIQQARHTLLDSADRAAQRQVSLLDSDDERVVLQSANAILDRVFEKDKASPQIIIEADKVELLSVALRESQEIRKDFVDVKAK